MEKATQTEIKNNTVTDLKSVWKEVLCNLEAKTNSSSFSTWFSDTYIMKIKEGVVSIGVQNEFVRQWIQEKYQKDLLREIRDIVDGSVRSIKIVISNRVPKSPPIRNVPIKQNGFSSVVLPFDQLEINRENNLNPRYNFEKFVVCPFNEFVYATATAIVENPGMSYNPFYIHGSTGCGKTHVLQAIGNALKKAHPSIRILYSTSEMFANAYITSIQKGTTSKFKEKYRGVDVFLMDDTQFFASKEKTQEEFFHTLNTLLDSNKQLAFTSDLHPAEISGMSERLKSRFSAGMVTHLPQPDLESRMLILREKLKEKGCVFEDKIIEIIAKEAKGNVRSIEGLANSIEMEIRIKKGQIPTIENLISIVRNVTRPKGNVSPDNIVRKVCGYYKVEESAIMSTTRRREVVKARQVIMFILRDYVNVSYSSIGVRLKRDHTTVMHSCERIRDSIDNDAVLRSDINSLREMLNIV